MNIEQRLDKNINVVSYFLSSEQARINYESKIYFLMQIFESLFNEEVAMSKYTNLLRKYLKFLLMAVYQPPKPYDYNIVLHIIYIYIYILYVIYIYIVE